MKIRNNLMIIAALCFAVFVLGACGYWEGLNADGQGSIRINFENSGARYAVNEDGMIYKITLRSPGKAPITITTGTSIIIPVPEGNWNIEVNAEGERVIGEGKTNVKVTAGKIASADIPMKVIGTRVYTWKDLSDDFAGLNEINGKLKDLEYIEIADDLTANSGLTFSTRKTITLRAKKDVTIKRDSNMNGAPVFTIKNCTLILDGTKGGTITIKGNGNSNCTNSLINVEDNSTLKIIKDVTITGNITAGNGGYGGGIYIKKGTCFMEGGVISGNTADKNGGGVYIHADGGTFKKTGGIIYGNNGSSNSNVANSSGHAVYSAVGNTKYSDTTLGEKDNWSAP